MEDDASFVHTSAMTTISSLSGMSSLWRRFPRDEEEEACDKVLKDLANGLVDETPFACTHPDCTKESATP